MRPTLAVTITLLLFLAAGAAEAADSMLLAETGGFCSGMLIAAESQPSASSGAER
jgi:hypothetical protein